MAQYTFFVDRRNRNEPPLKCVADLPSMHELEDLVTFKGGNVTVHANGSTFQIEVESGLTLAEKQLRIQLQKVRDLVLPKNEAAPAKISKRSESGFKA